MKLRNLIPLLGLVAVCFAPHFASGQQQTFPERVGPVEIGDFQYVEGAAIETPFILWGGDIATFHANGGNLATQDGSIFQQQGLNLTLTPGDDFAGQVRNYLSGKTPFLRGTYSMLGQASELINSDPRTQAVVFLQLTWSAGDHMVAREQIKTLNDLKGKKVALQAGGPHAGLLDDILRTARLDWSDVEVVWMPNLTGENSPAEIFQNDDTIAACMVVTPDLVPLVGAMDIDAVGDFGKGIIGAHVLESTGKSFSRSICDVYACRKDFYDAHKDLVEAFTAGYLKASEDMLEMSKLDEDGNRTPEYNAILEFAQTTWTPDVLPTLDDTDGLFRDCNLVGLPGNKKFFEEEGNLSGFNVKEDRALQLALTLKDATEKHRFAKPGFDYDKVQELGKLIIGARAFVYDPTKYDLGETVASYTISFDPNNVKTTIDAEELRQAIATTSTAGNAVIEIRGHADPTHTLIEFVNAGMASGAITRSGESGSYEYSMNGEKLDLTDTKKMAELIRGSDFAKAKESIQLAEQIAVDRADAARTALLNFAKANSLQVEETQFLSESAGITEPVIPLPLNLAEAKQNRRVEFRIRSTKVKAEKEKEVQAEIEGVFFN